MEPVCCYGNIINGNDIDKKFCKPKNVFLREIFAGEVMTSFNHVVIATRGNWFQTNSLEHEHDESDSCVAVCVFQIMMNIYCCFVDP